MPDGPDPNCNGPQGRAFPHRPGARRPGGHAATGPRYRRAVAGTVHPRVVIVGAGFGGLQCARHLAGEPVDVLVVDRRNYHLFTPLLYQVASCLLGPSEITAPLRKVFRGAPNVRIRMGEVVAIDTDRRAVRLGDGDEIAYDHLVLAAGSTTDFFGNDEIAKHALGLKDLAEALQLRNHVLECLERATATADARERERLLTFCIVGGGPTGVEFAGALAELVRLVLPHEYPEIAPSDVRIVLLEGADRLLSTFAPSLSAYARRELERRGVDVHTGTLVASAGHDRVRTRDGDEIATATMVWTAGVRPAPLAAAAGLPVGRSGRLRVDERLRVPGAPGVWAIGDAADATDRKGDPLPMTSPPAMQAGRYVARAILGRASRPFRYRDKGTLATIGRTAAVGQVGRLRFRGFLGWVVWLVVHLYYLIGFGNRLFVMLRWSWYYLRDDRPVRVVIRAGPPRGTGSAVSTAAAAATARE
ncbi:MAG: pyridine nucleotide-disulfide oxidoreductase [Acidimicrobiia bacterium]|nr:MAG: pyridine nucleotide-disulfide oxidoreductase [Acidimicrobiia bacterium]